MINVKDEIFAALSQRFNNVSDQYPEDFLKLPAIQYIEEENKVLEHTFSGGKVKEDKSQLRYRIDIWDKKSTSSAAVAVDDALSNLGLVRTQCTDDPSANGFRHKIMRYEGIIDNDTKQVYWNK
jgi:hypothetical protein